MPGHLALDLLRRSFILAPGADPEVTQFTIGNSGEAVDRVTVRVDGLQPGWYTLGPGGTASLFPGDVASFTLAVHPPEDALADLVPFQVVAVSSADRNVIARAEAEIEVLGNAVVEIVLRPERLRTSKSAAYAVGLSNGGSRSVAVRLNGSTPMLTDLSFASQPEEVVIPARGSALATLKVTLLDAPLVGVPRTFPFELTAAPVDAAEDPPEPIARTRGELVHKPVLGFLVGARPVLQAMVTVLVLFLVVLVLIAWPLGAPGKRTVGVPTVAPAAVASPEPGSADAPAAPAAGEAESPEAVAAAQAVAAEQATAEAAATEAAVAAVAAEAAQASAAATAAALPPPPKILSFAFRAISSGGVGVPTLAWEVDGARETFVEERVDEEPDPASLEQRRPSAALEAVEYTLVAVNEGGEARQSLRVYYARPAEVTSFSSSRGTIAAGDPVRLTWTTDRASRLTLDGAPLPLDQANGSVEMRPAGTTDYELRAANAAGDAVARLRVVVGGAATPTPRPTETPTPAPTPSLSPTAAGTPATATTPGATPPLAGTPATQSTPAAAPPAAGTPGASPPAPGTPGGTPAAATTPGATQPASATPRPTMPSAVTAVPTPTAVGGATPTVSSPAATPTRPGAAATAAPSPAIPASPTASAAVSPPSTSTPTPPPPRSSPPGTPTPVQTTVIR